MITVKDMLEKALPILTRGRDNPDLCHMTHVFEQEIEAAQNLLLRAWVNQITYEDFRDLYIIFHEEGLTSYFDMGDDYD